MHTESRIEVEDGRYVVYLDVFMVDERDRPIGVESKRIAEYPRKRDAEIAASWMLRAARRNPRGQTGT